MRKVLIWMIFMLLIVSKAFAESVVVTGVGIDRNMAIQDARRNAVEKVVGTYISSTTIYISPDILRDEIYSKAYGFVKDVQILKDLGGNPYRIQTRIEVDNNPDSQLVNKLEALRVLNDPRISVVIEYTSPDDYRVKHRNLCESVITSKLQESGFTNILDKSVILRHKLEGAGGGYEIDDEVTKVEGDVGELIITDDSVVDVVEREDSSDALFRGTEEVTETDEFLDNPENRELELPLDGSMNYARYLPNSDTDYLIYGILEVTTKNIQLPKYSDMNKEENNTYDTGLLRTLAILDIKVFKSDTQEVIATHTLRAQSMHSDEDFAEIEAVKKVAINAADRLAKSFTQRGASIASGFTIKARMDSDKILEKFIADLKAVAGVRNVTFRNYTAGKATIEVDTDLKTHQLFRLIKENSKLGYYLENASESLLEVSVS